ncbi:epoxyqueuosine reductase QueH [Geotalea sp. SG265]|uniref:epoxyqueuosine reductase QueH n=1 Tax=Geotalea sp. SG265 TaxID=2922867 RepID=UPI001FAFA521|nr:epoxyqueuosine reductase QueH [Geotalea sp. SG265]
MKILFHICCAPCAIYPIKEMRSNGMEVTGYFFNHNIHPYQEYRRRLETVRQYAEMIDLDVIYRDDYLLEDFLASVAPRPADRCIYCYGSRLAAAAAVAAERGFDAYSSSLLYSRYQKHEEIKELGEKIGERYGIPFHYSDYRRGWKEGIDISKKMGLYRQQYCGCIYSEKDRYHPHPVSDKEQA